MKDSNNLLINAISKCLHSMTVIGMTYPLQGKKLKMGRLTLKRISQNKYKRANKIKYKINSNNKEKVMIKC